MQTISKEVPFYQMRLRHMIKITLFSWRLYRYFLFSLNAWKDFQLDFNIVSIKTSLKNALTQMQAKNPMQKSEKRNPNWNTALTWKRATFFILAGSKLYLPVVSLRC